VKRAYFDASAIVKLEHVERWSQDLIDYLEENDVEASTSIVAQVEVVRALRRVAADSRAAIRGFFLLSLDSDVCQEAAKLGSPLVRSIDAIHIATALAIGDRDLDFVTYDDRMAEAARECGLKVVQPGR
jgi:predicted nucleic acid-binding protein